MMSLLSLSLWPLAGRSYCVRTQRMLNQCLESLVQKVQSGVVINFERSASDPPVAGEGRFHQPAFSPESFHLEPFRINSEYWTCLNLNKAFIKLETRRTPHSMGFKIL